MRVDFYVLGASAADTVVTSLAARALGAGHRLLIVVGDEARRAEFSRALWQARPEHFLANGDAGAPHAARQPILLSDRPDPRNGAQIMCLADGLWREAQGFERVLYLFGDAHLAEARAQWRRLGERAEIERRYWKQDQGGRWSEGP